jgi:hypothetical protein
LLGASPDALIQYPDGTVEVLEVKNHCPFYRNSSGSGKSNNSKYNGGHDHNPHQFRIRAFDDPPTEVPLMYLPQLMMEMYCVGPHCKSAVMVRQTATNGVRAHPPGTDVTLHQIPFFEHKICFCECEINQLALRFFLFFTVHVRSAYTRYLKAALLRVQRNESWIDEMVFFLHEFKHEYVDSGALPPPNFFWESTNATKKSRYQRFLALTKEIGSSVEVIKHVEHGDIQRAVAVADKRIWANGEGPDHAARPSFATLFLDAPAT